VLHACAVSADVADDSTATLKHTAASTVLDSRIG
jgi:hypothetical protein